MAVRNLFKDSVDRPKPNSGDIGAVQKRNFGDIYSRKKIESIFEARKGKFVGG
jgi:hypothetical protein